MLTIIIVIIVIIVIIAIIIVIIVCAFYLHFRQLDDGDVETGGRDAFRVKSHEVGGEHPFANKEGHRQPMAVWEAHGEFGERDEMSHSRAWKDDHMRLWASHGNWE